MSHINFQPKFDYIDEAEKRIKTEIIEDMATKADIQRFIDTIGSLAKRSNDSDDKIIILENKTERIEHWVMKAAEEIEIPYKP